jgi:hypothetical protein
MAQSTSDSALRFARRTLPWVLGAAFLALYLVTLNRWMTSTSQLVVSKVAGWDWNTVLSLPLLHLLTLPFRALPESVVPIALNAATAVLAMLTIKTLARSVALLPQDRTRDQRQRERDPKAVFSGPLPWVPPTLACLACGLQLTFWEHATAITGEMLNLLIFAQVIRCLLEYRLFEETKWMYQAALLCGLGMTNSFAMIAYLPMFIGATIWIRGMKFFDFEFLSRMFLWALLGLSVYLLLPAIQLAAKTTDATFFEYLKAQLGGQKELLLYGPLRSRAIILSFTSILPLILISIRWPSSFGDMSAMGSLVTTLMFRVFHMAILGICVFVAFDPDYSPRELGYGLSFLSFYYIGALLIGYCSAYVLLVFGKETEKAWKKPSALGQLLNTALVAAVVLGVVALPAALAAKNWTELQTLNGSLRIDYANALADELPAEPAYVLCDDAVQLDLVHAAILESIPEHWHVFVLSSML